jgi:hypothetical protein
LSLKLVAEQQTLHRFIIDSMFPQACKCELTSRGDLPVPRGLCRVRRAWILCCCSAATRAGSFALPLYAPNTARHSLIQRN